MRRVWIRLRIRYFRTMALLSHDYASLLRWRMKLQAERAKL